MTPETVITIAREAMTVTALLGAPLLLSALAARVTGSLLAILLSLVPGLSLLPRLAALIGGRLLPVRRRLSSGGRLI